MMEHDGKHYKVLLTQCFLTLVEWNEYPVLTYYHEYVYNISFRLLTHYKCHWVNILYKIHFRHLTHYKCLSGWVNNLYKIRFSHLTHYKCLSDWVNNLYKIRSGQLTCYNCLLDWVNKLCKIRFRHLTHKKCLSDWVKNGYRYFTFSVYYICDTVWRLVFRSWSKRKELQFYFQ